MSFTDKLKGNWNQIKGDAKQKWGDLTEDDFTKAEGSWDEFVGIVQEKTGEAKDEIQKFFNDLGDKYDNDRNDVKA